MIIEVISCIVAMLIGIAIGTFLSRATYETGHRALRETKRILSEIDQERRDDLMRRAREGDE